MEIWTLATIKSIWKVSNIKGVCLRLELSDPHMHSAVGEMVSMI